MSDNARDRIIEECARVAEEHGSQFALAETVCTPGVFACLAKAIRALKQEPASDGWRPIDSAPRDGTVPREPTQEMLDAGYAALSAIYPPDKNGGWAIGQHIVWEKMYDAAIPVPPRALKQGGQE